MSAKTCRAEVVVFGVLFCIAATGCGQVGGHDHAFTSRDEGVAVRYPDNWRLTTRNDNYVPDPALCFDLTPRGDAKVDLRLGGGVARRAH